MNDAKKYRDWQDFLWKRFELPSHPDEVDDEEASRRYQRAISDTERVYLGIFWEKFSSQNPLK